MDKLTIGQENLYNTHFINFDEIIFPFCFCSVKLERFQNPCPFYFAVRSTILRILALFPKELNKLYCVVSVYIGTQDHIVVDSAVSGILFFSA